MKTDETNPQDWFLLGRERLEAADAVRAAQGASNSAVELLQESVERYLKGFSIATPSSVLRPSRNSITANETPLTWDLPLR